MLSNNSLQRYEIDILKDVGHICIELENFDQAEELFIKTMNVNKNKGSMVGEAYDLLNLGKLSEAKRNIGQAIDHTEKALGMFKQLDYADKSKSVEETLHRLQNEKIKK